MNAPRAPKTKLRKNAIGQVNADGFSTAMAPITQTGGILMTNNLLSFILFSFHGQADFPTLSLTQPARGGLVGLWGKKNLVSCVPERYLVHIVFRVAHQIRD